MQASAPKGSVAALLCRIMLCALPVGNAYSAGKLDFNADLELFGGYESNIFRNTHNMHYPPRLGGRSYDPVTGDIAGGGALKAQAVLDLNESSRLTATVKGYCQAYPGHVHANQGNGESRFEYRLRPNSVLSFKVPVDVGYNRKLGVDENANETNLLEYWALNAAPHVEMRMSERLDLRWGYQFSLRDYRDTDTAASFDNTQNEFSVLIEPHFGRELSNTVGIECAYVYKSYRELGSYDRTGTYYDNPLRSYHYLSLEMSYKHDFGPAAWKIAYRPQYRHDPFRGFYSYLENRVSSRISVELKSLTSFAAAASWKFRHYLVHTAAQPGSGPEPQLAMHYLDISADVEQPIGKRLSLFSQYELNSRNTNSTVLYFHTYRDYANNMLRAGMRLRW